MKRFCPFELPDGYRREFLLQLDNSRHCLVFDRGCFELGSEGEPANPRQDDQILDWLEDCVNQVRAELGK